jgi:RNA polymerase sigma factor (sigma-70 family)
MAGRSTLITCFQEVYGDLLRFLSHRIGDTDRAAEIAQSTYLRLVAIPPGGAEIHNPRAFIYRVANNLAIDALRRDGRAATYFTPGPDESVHDPAPSPEATLMHRQRLRALDAALGELPENARLALLMFRLDGLTHTEIAGRLGVSESMVAKYIGRALRHCRVHLRQIE